MDHVIEQMIKGSAPSVMRAAAKVILASMPTNESEAGEEDGIEKAIRDLSSQTGADVSLMAGMVIGGFIHAYVKQHMQGSMDMSVLNVGAQKPGNC